MSYLLFYPYGAFEVVKLLVFKLHLDSQRCGYNGENTGVAVVLGYLGTPQAGVFALQAVHW